ncbi:sn-glycerol-3-phosphate transport system permease protein UgpE [Paenibacillus marchantiophytorum]|uniref:Sn-glycerol-3-phosphate transport system permease protein UgpE n=1 Tax=Paenibacillus marchantiophytorum TaxID=1619310 RepID=A0ABQ1EN96_9BACL|nr:carbohydrate ABC transporter permease [Paenibacillus marchantiophytorum]GFZ79461.1 sn-glycerol-3-phosphate transport system permease protein UgpE [Paenibacillus marchantiophytorum]
MLLSVGSIGMIFPLVWMIATSLKASTDAFSLSVIPTGLTLDNYVEVFKKTPFTQWVRNSLVVAVITTLSVCFFDTIIGYVLAKFTFVGKKLIFVAILSTLMVPTEMLIIPWYLLTVKFGWVDSYAGILFPGLISAFGIFLMKQFMESLPGDLLDAARIDGMNEWSIMLRIAVPLVKPALATLCILSFLGSWNAFIWPLIVTQTPEHLTIPVGISYFSSELKDRASWVLVMTGASLSVIPLIVLFFVFQKQIIRGIALTGFK